MAQSTIKLNKSSKYDLGERAGTQSHSSHKISTNPISKASMENFLEALGITPINEAQNTPKSAISLRNVIKTYGEGENQIHALQNINLEVQQGEIITVMGPSGSGKSTLLNLLGAMDDPTSGQVLVDGLDISTLKEKNLSSFRKNSIGFIFQDFYLIPNLSVLDNVLTPLIPYGISQEDKRRAMNILNLVGLGDRAKSSVDKLSGGQKQRIAIARSLINNPNIILADEPTGNLDSETGRDIIELLLDLSTQGKTIIIVTHDPRIGHLIASHPTGKNVWMEDGFISEKATVNADCW